MLDFREMEKLKDFNIFTNEDFNNLLNIMFSLNEDLTYKLFNIEQYLKKYKVEFYQKNENVFINIQINNKDEILLFYPYHRVYSIILYQLFVFIISGDNIYNIKTLDAEKFIKQIKDSGEINFKQLEKILIDNEVKFIKQKIKRTLSKSNNIEKVNFLNDFIKFFNNIIQEQINLAIEIDNKFNLTNGLNKEKEFIKVVYILENCLKMLERLSKNGLLKVIKSLEQQKHKIHNSKNDTELITISQTPDDRKLSIQPKLQNIKVQRQLIIVLMLSYYKALDNEIKSQKALYKNLQINQSSLIESLLNYFDYDGDIYLLQRSVHFFDIEVVDLGHIIDKENKQLCIDLIEYIKTKEYDFMKMLKFRKKSMVNY